MEWVFPSLTHQPDREMEKCCFFLPDMKLNLLQGGHCHGNGGTVLRTGGQGVHTCVCPIEMQSRVLYGPKGEHSFRDRIGVPAMIQTNSFFWQVLLTQPNLSPLGIEVKFLGSRGILYA